MLTNVESIKKTAISSCFAIRHIWWAIRDLNPGPNGYEPCALTN